MDKETIFCLQNMKSGLYAKAKDVSIFLEDGQYYIRCVGVINDGNDEYELVVPKMDINVTAITQNVDEGDD